MMNPLHYTLVLILLLLTYYQGGFCLQSDSSPSSKDTRDLPDKTISKKTTESNSPQFSKEGVKKSAEETKPVVKNADGAPQAVLDVLQTGKKAVRQEIKQPDRPAANNIPPAKSDQPSDPEKQVHDTMINHDLAQAVNSKELEEKTEKTVPSGSCIGKQTDGVLCEDVKKVISPEIPKVSQEKVPPEGVKVQEEGIKAPPEVTGEQAKTDSISDPEPVKQDESPKDEEKAAEAPKPAEVGEGEAPKAAEVDESKVPVANETNEEVKVDEKKDAAVPTEKKEGTTTSDAETVTPPINVIVPHHEEEDMPSFNEWKKQQHEAKKEEEKGKSKQNGHTSQQGSTGSQLTRPNTMRTNFASLSCGAKVLSHNPEVQHASYTLNDNKDEYMINPCSANKWFIVELCEPVQVKFIEVANYELFSSLPKEVRLHTSDKYPTKDWKLLDTYTASEDRKIHIFPVIGQQLYSKYLKVEVLSYFGTEHYCPLTLLRVFGTSYAEIDDDDDHDEVHASDEQVQADSATNIFTSASDIVMNVVKKVLSGGDDKQKPLDAPADRLGENVNKSMPCSGRQFRPTNDDANATEDYSLPCLPEQVDQNPYKGQIKPDVPRANTGPGVLGSNIILDTVIRPSVPYPTVPQPVASQISQTVPFVNVINYGATTLGAIYSLFKNCRVCETPQSKHRTFSPLIGHSSCIYMCILTKCWGRFSRCCKSCHRKRDLKDNPIPAVEQIDLYTTTVISSVKATMQPSASPQVTADGVAGFEKPTAGVPPAGVTVTTTSVHIPLTTPDSLTINIIQPTKTLKSDNDVIGSVQSSVTSTINANKDSPKTMTLVSASKHVMSSEKVVPTTVTLSSSMPVSTAGPDVAQGSPSSRLVSSTTQTVIKPSVVVKESVTPKEEINIPPPAEAKKVDPPIEVVHQNGNSNSNGAQIEEPVDVAQNGGKDTLASNGNGDQVVLDLPVAGAASAGKRESAIMRLNNRVKALELNMSLSSRYLEELSQRYKKQMEAMYRSFNITIGRLMNTSKWAEQSDQRQKEKTTKLHGRIEELTQVVDNLTKDLDKMNVKHLENHLVFLVLETMVMFILFLMCSRRNKQRTTQAELQELLANMPDHPKLMQRHNSDPAIHANRSVKPAVPKTRSLSDVETKHAGSDGNLYILEPTNFPFLNENKDLTEGKKRKRKKSKKLQRAQSAGQFSPGVQQSASNTTIASAGLLFGNDQEKNIKCASVNGVRMRTLSRSSSMNHIDVIFENSSSSCDVSSQSTEGFTFEHMTSNEVAKKRVVRHSPKSSLEYGAFSKNRWQDRQEPVIRESRVRDSPPFQKKYGKKFVEDVGVRYNGHGPPRRVLNSVPSEERSLNNDPAQHLRMQRQFYDTTESYSDSGKRPKFRKHEIDTHSDNGRVQHHEYVDNFTDLPAKPKKRYDPPGKKKPFDGRQFDGQLQGPGHGRGRGRGGYRGRSRNDMDGLGGFKTWVSYRQGQP